jgi:uncharacterized membrane protein YgcG
MQGGPIDALGRAHAASSVVRVGRRRLRSGRLPALALLRGRFGGGPMFWLGRGGGEVGDAVAAVIRAGGGRSGGGGASGEW